MKIFKFRLTAILILGFHWSTFTQAQESINSSGGDSHEEKGIVSYSFGQVFYTTNAGVLSNVAQGVQQAFEILSVDVKEKEQNIKVAIFPNPTTENLILQIKGEDNENFSYQLYDLTGKLLFQGQIFTNQTHINTSNLPAATYLINILNFQNKKMQTLKIIKQ